MSAWLILDSSIVYVIKRTLRLQTGADPEVDEGGGGAHIEWSWCGHAARAARGIFSLRTYNAQRSRRVWGHAPLGKFLSLDHMRVLLRPSETTITTQNV